jgi:hypothetical protein
MYMALIALLGAASTWVVLRKNPAFSARYVLRFFLVLAAMVGTLVLAILTTLKYTERFPQSVQLAAIFGVVGVGTLAMIAVAIQGSLPEGAPLPASAKRLNVFQKRTYVWARRLGWALLAFALAVLLRRATGRGRHPGRPVRLSGDRHGVRLLADGAQYRPLAERGGG